MKRDMDIVLMLLKHIESESESSPLRTTRIELPGCTADAVDYHANLLLDAELIAASPMDLDARPHALRIERLTWEGHEFLDAASNDTVWRAAKKRIAEFGSSVPFSVLQSLLTQLVKNAVIGD